jgi:ABC-type lipoprotein release transport system permease subunit
VIGIRRRRRDLAILKTLGFDRGQVRAAVAWQATTLAGIGVIVGVPLGIVVGRVAWQLVADDLGVGDTTSVPVLRLVVVAALAIVLANLIAWFPARSAARTRPAIVLRSE